MPLEITLTNEQKVKVTLNPVTQGGHPAQLDGVPTWEVVNGEATVDVAADGKSCEILSGDDPGDSEILVKADADLGAGVIEISDVIQLHVGGAAATSLGMTAGTPEQK